MRAEKPLTISELKRSLSATRDFQEALLIATFACSGAKLNEVLGMQICDVWHPAPTIGGRRFPSMAALADRLAHYARNARVAMEPVASAPELLLREPLWLTQRGRVPYTRNSIAIMFGRISEGAGVEITATRFRITRLAYLWHELKRGDADALQRFAGLGSQFEIVRRVEEAILARPEALEDVAPGWEDALVESALPPLVQNVA